MGQELGSVGRIWHQDEVGVTDQQQDRSLDAAELVFGPAVETLDHRRRLLGECLEMGRIGRDRCVGLALGSEVGFCREALGVGTSSS
ncbi:MAG TPA: hypothetical protein VGI44_09215 [Acidimicrobiales bacterium]